MAKNKYSVPDAEKEGKILPNLLDLKTVQEIQQAELEGFLYAYKVLFDELSANTRFTLEYILKMHHLALGHLYAFAGKARAVNISKDGFMFPPSKFLDQSLKEFDKNMLQKLPDEYESREELIKDIAKIHGEFLFIHPFREGNGRTARLLAALMAAKAGHNLPSFENFSKEKFNEYVAAVKSSAAGDYSKMEKIIASLF
ncbi:MAG TPA: Fic family protein [Bacteroidia bacterium]|jgi:cell filamentation protein|nr:Fic family protein [Bacteroidia bacterium]